MYRNIFFFLTLIIAGSMHALEVGISMSNATTNNDNHSEEASGSAVVLTSASSLTINDEVGLSVTVGGQAYGYVASRSYNGYITQSVNIKATYTILAAEDLEYSIQFNPEFHGMFRITESGNASGNSVVLSSLTARLNNTVIPSLGMSGASQDGVTSATYDQSASYTLLNQWGNNVYELVYTFTITADSQDSNWLGGGVTTSDAFLWGMDNSSFNTYPNVNLKDADGLFLPATVTILSTPTVPEPSTYAGITALALLSTTLALRRRQPKSF